jgi:hypothetical protein
MATINPRLSVTVTPRVDAVLTRFATATGQSKSATVGGILDESYDMLAKMVKVIEAARAAQSNMPQQVIQPFKDAHSHLEQQLGLVLADVHHTADDLLRDVEQIERRTRKAARTSTRRGAASGRERNAPPLSNRGGKPIREKQAGRTKSLKGKAKVAS